MTSNKEQTQQRKTIPILFEDEHFIAFNKPAGVLVIPSPKKEKHTLIERVNEQYAQDQEWNLHPCHRLDKDTSGIILFAKGKKIQQLMMEEFKERQVKKTYIAFVYGRIEQERGEIKSIIQDQGHLTYNRSKAGKMAITQFQVIERRKNFTIVEVNLLTGRTNQIRVHFKSKGHPLVGDRKYTVVKKYSAKFKRTALHASYLQWMCPMSQKKIQVVCPLAEDMETFLKENK